jgi:hypothetical protein
MDAEKKNGILIFTMSLLTLICLFISGVHYEQYENWTAVQITNEFAFDLFIILSFSNALYCLLYWTTKIIGVLL